MTGWLAALVAALAGVVVGGSVDQAWLIGVAGVAALVSGVVVTTYLDHEEEGPVLEPEPEPVHYMYVDRPDGSTWRTPIIGNDSTFGFPLTSNNWERVG